MPLKLQEPTHKYPNWRVRGTYLGTYIDRSTGTRDKALAKKILANLKADIERGELAGRAEPTWANAVISYVRAHDEANNRYLEPLTRYFGLRLLRDIKQEDVDEAADKLYPDCKPSTRNRAVYTPVMAVLRHAGFPYLRSADGGQHRLKRPRGAQGEPRLVWLSPEEAYAVIDAARARAVRLQQAIEHAPPHMRENPRRAADAAHRFAVLCLFMLLTGTRLNEAVRVRPEDLELERQFCWCGKTKNGQPRAVHLPPRLIDELKKLEPGEHGRMFSAVKHDVLHRIAASAGVVIPEGIAYHIFRHTYGAWMRRYGGLDTSGLVGTGAWRSHSAARVYEHVETSEEARKADLLPTGVVIDFPGKIRA